MTYRFALGRSPTEGLLVGIQFGVGFSLAPNKGEALFMGVASGLFEAIIQQFFEKSDPLDVAAEAIKAFSDGVLDSVRMYSDRTFQKDSFLGTTPGENGSRFFVSIDRARAAIPISAVPLHGHTTDNVVESWEVMHGRKATQLNPDDSRPRAE